MQKLLRAFALFFIGILIFLSILIPFVTASTPALTICLSIFQKFKTDFFYQIFALCFFSFFFFKILISKIKLLSPLNSLFVFFDTLEHELTHLFMGLLHFKLPHKMTIDLKGNGAVHLIKPTLLIYMAPYMFSLWWLILEGVFIVLSFLNQTLSPEIHFLLRGILLGNFAHRLLNEIHQNQSDLKEGSFLLSLWFILNCQLLIVAILFLPNFPPNFEQTKLFYQTLKSFLNF